MKTGVSLKYFVNGCRNIKFGQQVNLIQRALLGTLPQEAVATLPHSHMTLTNLFISSYRGYCYQFWALKTTP